MAFPERLLGDDERLVLHQHQHWKNVALPVALVPVVVGVAAFGVAALPAGSVQGPGRWTIVGVALIVLVAFSLLPWLRWRATHFVLTDQRIVLRSGLLARSGRDIPLARINDVTFSHSLLERFFGCGTLVVESGGERGQIVLTDVPHVERVQRTLAGLVETSLEQRRLAAPGQRRPAEEHEPETDGGPVRAGD